MSRTLIIAEAGVNHNGDINLAKQLCLAAKESGADVVKFQTWKTDKIITRKVEQADYQKENTGNEQSQYDMLKELELSYDDFREIKKYCDDIGIVFASTADEEESLDFLIDLGIPFIKIGSGDIGNIPYLRYIGKKKLPIIMSTGMSTIDDVKLSMEALLSGGSNDISLMHCTTNYPCDFENVNLSAMDTLHNTFNVSVGYSDHTIGIEIPIAAVSKGATIIEKHFTLDRNMKGPDHLASTEPGQFKEMVRAIRNVEMAIGDGVKVPTEGESEISRVVYKRIVAVEPIKKGDIITAKALGVKRNDTGVFASDWDNVIGKIATQDFNVDDGIIF